MRCPNCYTCVASPAFHFQDSLHQYGKQYVINWERAKDIMKNSKDPLIGRQLLDEVLDYRCNPYFGTVTDSCVGCALTDRNYFGHDILLTVTIIYCLVISVFPYMVPGIFKELPQQIFMVRSTRARAIDLASTPRAGCPRSD